MRKTQLFLLMKVMRPQQWIKNTVCLTGLIFSGKLFDSAAQIGAALAFAAFSMAASSIYLFNDFCDRKRDRENPRTAHRPLAAGTLSIPIAVAAWVVLASLANLIAYTLNRNCQLVVLIYLASNVAYSLRIKLTVIMDVLVIAFGFVLRVLIGVYAVDALPSSWIVLCMFMLALFLGFSKRRGELVQLGESAAHARPVLRKYTLEFLNNMLMISAALSIMTYAMYTTTSGQNANLVITALPVTYCIFRYFYKVVVESFGESPEKLLYRDPLLWLGVMSWMLMVIFFVYLQPDLQLFATRHDH